MFKFLLMSHIYQLMDTHFCLIWYKSRLMDTHFLVCKKYYIK
nr:MAG TPA: hypothetical protein [Caudoviricetes sp.]DAX82197.1 MAG TPA: hypothetical protein [Caudoviricetes sp.]